MAYEKPTPYMLRWSGVSKEFMSPVIHWLWYTLWWHALSVIRLWFSDLYYWLSCIFYPQILILAWKHSGEYFYKHCCNLWPPYSLCVLVPICPFFLLHLISKWKLLYLTFFVCIESLSIILGIVWFGLYKALLTLL